MMSDMDDTPPPDPCPIALFIDRSMLEPFSSWEYALLSFLRGFLLFSVGVNFATLYLKGDDAHLVTGRQGSNGEKANK